MNFLPIYVFSAGSDQTAHQGNPRRFNISRDGCRPAAQGWTKVFDFTALNAPVPGTFPVYVAEAGGTGPTDPYRFLVDRSPGASRGWNDSYSFHAFQQPVPGTIPFYVMSTGGASEFERHHSEITTNPAPHSGWHLSLTFHAYPSDYTPPQMTLYVSQTNPHPPPHRFRIAQDYSNPGGWIHTFTFRAYSTPEPNTFPIYVSKAGDGGATGPHRYRLGKENYGKKQGWTADYQFYGLNYPAPGTVPVYVMDAGGEVWPVTQPEGWHRYKLSLVDDAQTTRWRNQFTFYAYPA